MPDQSQSYDAQAAALRSEIRALQMTLWAMDRVRGGHAEVSESSYATVKIKLQERRAALRRLTQED